MDYAIAALLAINATLVVIYGAALWGARKSIQSLKAAVEEREAALAATRHEAGCATDGYHTQLREVIAAYQQLLADTPARGEDGRFVER